jgi:hypothetical protein
MKKKITKKQEEKKTEKQEIFHVHPELEGFEIGINSFGEIVSNFDIDRINAFLNKNVADKKLKDINLENTETKEDIE